MRGQQGGQQLNNHWLVQIESAYRASVTNFNFTPDYNKICVVASNVPSGPLSATCLQPIKSSTGCVVDQLNDKPGILHRIFSQINLILLGEIVQDY